MGPITYKAGLSSLIKSNPWEGKGQQESLKSILVLLCLVKQKAYENNFPDEMHVWMFMGWDKNHEDTIWVKLFSDICLSRQHTHYELKSNPQKLKLEQEATGFVCGGGFLMNKGQLLTDLIKTFACYLVSYMSCMREIYSCQHNAWNFKMTGKPLVVGVHKINPGRWHNWFQAVDNFAFADITQ